jgi:hypothetical protein
MTESRRTVSFRNPRPADSSESGKLVQRFLEAQQSCDPLAADAIRQVLEGPPVRPENEFEGGTIEDDFNSLEEGFARLLEAFAKSYEKLAEESTE